MAGRKIGSLAQGVDESVAYQVQCEPAAVGSVVVAVYDETDGGADVTAAVMPAGSATVSGGNITLPLLTGLEARHTYRVEVRYSDGTNTLEPFFVVAGER
jgi:hypothetical protein